MSNVDRILVARAAAVLAGIWLGLRLFTFSGVLETVDRLSKPGPHPRDSGHDPDRIVWAILAVSRYSPLTPTCLVQALAAKITLGREGYRALVRIGVATTADGRLRAHAWLEYDGEILIGRRGREGFHPLPCFDQGQP